MSEWYCKVAKKQTENLQPPVFARIFYRRYGRTLVQLYVISMPTICKKYWRGKLANAANQWQNCQHTDYRRNVTTFRCRAAPFLLHYISDWYIRTGLCYVSHIPLLPNKTRPVIIMQATAPWTHARTLWHPSVSQWSRCCQLSGNHCVIVSRVVAMSFRQSVGTDVLRIKSL